jgi:hypothetical protein
MHAYRWDTAKLSRKLEGFVGGQFRIENPKSGLVLQCQINHCTLPKLSQKRIEIIPEWMATRSFVFRDSWQPREHWVRINPPLGQPVMFLDFTSYYFQREHHGVKGKADREERVKLWTKQGEVCRFYQIGDPLILMEKDGSFVPSSPPEDGPRIRD